MVLKQLAYLVALARERHFGRAAAACKVSQPTLSTAIRELEEELGVPIVLRGRRFEGFTPEGVRVLGWAERILADRDSLVQDLSDMRGSLHGHLRISVVPTALPVVARLTAPFSARHPRVTVSATVASSVSIQRGLDNFELDLGITYLDNEPILRVRSFPLYRERYCLLVPSGVPPVERTRISWREAAKKNLCLLTPDMQNRRIIDAAFRAAGAVPDAHVETNSITGLILHVQSGQWASVVPRHFLVTPGLPDGVRAIDLVEPELSHLVGVVVADREPLAPTAKAMLEIVTALSTKDMFEPSSNPN
ncbi:MAG: LysR family transcriptional regulator [Alphaproteobacteria bacterium]|nr:LysR family transcriptional regulator [Alphaproteobacteria bacterium]